MSFGLSIRSVLAALSVCATAALAQQTELAALPLLAALLQGLRQQLRVVR